MRATVRATLRRRGLFGRGARVLVACSGGPDSVVMADVLVSLATELDLSLTVTSVDHGLRPEAASEVALVGSLAEDWGVPFVPLTLGLESGPGVQARARAARYVALEQLRQELGAHVVAVGHTRDDQAETVLSRLLRGSGVRGLRGIWPARPDGVVRPLIDVDRADVRAYLAERSEASEGDRRNVCRAVSDPSNNDRAFERVRLRHDTLPALRAEDPEVVRHLAELADDARDLVELAEGAAAELLRRTLTVQAGQRVLPIQPLRAAPRAVRREALRQLLAGAPVAAVQARRAHLLELERAVLGGAGAHVLVGAGLAYRRLGAALHELAGDAESGEPAGGLRPRSEETTKLYV